MIAIGNSGDASLVPIAAGRLDDASPLVRAMAIWALGRLCDPPTLAGLARSHATREQDAAVREEWRTAVSSLGRDGEATRL